MKEPKINKKALPTGAKRYDPVAPLLAVAALAAILWHLFQGKVFETFFDPQAIVVIIGGLAVATLWQYSFSSILQSVRCVGRTFLPGRNTEPRQLLRKLDLAITQDVELDSLAAGESLTGDLLNDTVFLHRSGMSDEDIENYLCLRLEHEQSQLLTATQLLRKAATLAPALGLFGTVIGLISLLQALDDPSQIGTSMSMALLTTAYGSGLSSFILTPMSGRVANCAEDKARFFMEYLRKVRIIIKRGETQVVEGKYGRIA